MHHVTSPAIAATALFLHQLEQAHAAGEHVVPSYASCPQCALERARARARAGL